MVPKKRRCGSWRSRTSHRRTPRRGAGTAQFGLLCPAASQLSSAGAASAAAVQETSRAIKRSAGVTFFNERFIFIVSTTVFKIFELRGGGNFEPRGYYPQPASVGKARRRGPGR